MKIVFSIFLTLLLLIMPVNARAQEDQLSELKELDIRVLALKYYLTHNQSPLQQYADEFITIADKHNLEWKLLPAIAGVESNFGKRVPGGKSGKSPSYNAWGWGVYGDKVIRFRSWDQGIEKVAKGLKDKYINKGLTDSFKMNKKYSSNPDWGWQVSFFINDIDNYLGAFDQKFGAEIRAHNKLVRSANTTKSLPLPETKIIVNPHSLSTVDQSTIISF